MPYLNIPENTLPASISRLIGSLRGTFENDITSNVDSLGDSFKNGCPNAQEKLTLLTKLNNIKETSVNITDRLNRFRKITPPLKNSSRGILGLVAGLKLIPFPPFFPGGKIADALNLVKELGIQLKNTAESIETSLSQANGLQDILKKASNTSERIDTALELCELASASGTNPPPDLVNLLVNGTSSESARALRELNNIVGRDAGPTPTPTDTSSEVETYTRPDGQPYIIRIVQVKSDYTRAPRRQAIAEDSNGKKRFESSKSFSSSVEVLKREVKFRIDNSQV